MEHQVSSRAHWQCEYVYSVAPTLVCRGADHFDRLDFLLLPAFFTAMATACFCGLPAFISVLMFELIVLCDEPFFRGIITTPFFSGCFVEFEPSTVDGSKSSKRPVRCSLLRAEQ